MTERSMLAVLNAHPHEMAEVRDEASAVVLLRELLLLDKFMTNPDQSREWFSLILYADHPTHYLAAAKFEGLPNPDDNGHVVHCFPKSQVSAKQVEQVISENYSKVIGKNEVSARWVLSPKSYN